MRIYLSAGIAASRVLAAWAFVRSELHNLEAVSLFFAFRFHLMHCVLYVTLAGSLNT
jgi:hypothetical protein